MTRRPPRSPLSPHTTLYRPNILHEGQVAPQLAATADKLKHDKVVDALEHKLERRPDRKELEQQNILHAGQTPPHIAATADNLNHDKIVDALEHKLEHRPDPN